MDALVAYLQMLGTLVDFSTYARSRLPVGERIWNSITQPCVISPTAGDLSYMFVVFVAVVASSRFAPVPRKP
jgi:hypothetical protein